MFLPFSSMAAPEFEVSFRASLSKELIRKIERIQRRATKYILNLPFLCEESFKDGMIKLTLLSVSYWHEYLDIVFFFKSVTGLVKVNPTVIPTRRTRSRATKSSSNTNVTLFVPKICKTTTHQRSFFIRKVKMWNALADDIGLSVTLSVHSRHTYSVTISNHSVNHMTLKILAHLSLSAQVATKPVI